ncbi:hypothetical protein H5J25_20030 (plasmid) [Sphingomonas aliaeris]|uniref:Uncharacterized protein n=1 Tax=Sphingomonas aliaeris TaxID=2759526 RepID=A0A974S762_9SPHN|nr:hypothetical protein [Sphingomonas aliaeris]QQV79480.1 hypothetical protein H5J25_20030 [Sphingomonas aliaeris]
MFAYLSRATSALSASSSAPSRSKARPRTGLCKMMLATSEVAIRHHYAAPWLHDIKR